MTTLDTELHITVVALTEGREFALTDELALVKAGLLYADRVTLASPKAAMIETAAGYVDASPAERRALGRELVELLPDAATFIPTIRALEGKKHRTSAELIALHKLTAALDKMGKGFDDKIGEMVSASGLEELRRARSAGVLQVDSLGTEMHSTFTGAIASALGQKPASTDEMTRRVTTLIGQILHPKSTTYPMFSEVTGGLARAMVKEGKIAGAELAPATQAGIAGRFISALEAFPDAPIDVVLDARGQLRVPLRRFRAGVTRLSRELSERGIDALDPRFDRESADLYREHVAPALDEVRELMHELKLLPALARSTPGVAKDIGLAAAPLLAFAVTSETGIAALATAAAAGKAAMTGLDVIGRAAERQRHARSELAKNEYVFLFEAGRLLG